MQLRTHASFTLWWFKGPSPPEFISFSPLVPQLRVASSTAKDQPEITAKSQPMNPEGQPPNSKDRPEVLGGMSSSGAHAASGGDVGAASGAGAESAAGAAGAGGGGDVRLLEFVPGTVASSLPVPAQQLAQNYKQQQSGAQLGSTPAAAPSPVPAAAAAAVAATTEMAAAASAAAGSSCQSPSEQQGVWSVERFISLLLGEVPRLRDDPRGYGPRGRGFIDHVDIPEEVEAAHGWLAARYPYLVRG